MLRDIDLNEISDGRLYTANDMVKADCMGCQGCSSCCQDMGDSIVLDPYDMYRLCTGLKTAPAALLSSSLELGVVDGLILPHLKMNGTTDSCMYLNKDGRCSIHPFRPGFCRLFPLGRYYENDSFSYFLQTHECPKPGKAKIKVRKWIDELDFSRHEKFVSDWHYYLKPLQNYAMTSEDSEKIKTLSIQILQTFYLLPYIEDVDFNEQFYQRLSK